MSEDERRKVFWLLKKYSSFTAWKALGEAYFKFADAWMKAMQLADDEDIDDFNQNATKLILDGRVGFEKGLPLLRKGDRSVFRNNARGFLGVAADQIVFINRIMDPNEYVFDWMKNQEEVKRAAANLRERRRGLFSAFERADETTPAALGQMTVFDKLYAPFNFPPILPTVPPPTDTLIPTGAEVPADGIYEPEWPASGAGGMLGRLMGSGKGSAVEKGCMNYLLANTKAPLYQVGELDDPIPVTWRLIWQDTRYLDGTIPAEEADYLVVAEPSTAELSRLRCEAKQPCPKAGYWFTPAKPDSRRRFKQGEAMPDVGSSYGDTIWQWDENQSHR